MFVSPTFITCILGRSSFIMYFRYECTKVLQDEWDYSSLSFCLFSSPTRDQTPAVEGQSLKHRATKEIPPVSSILTPPPSSPLRFLCHFFIGGTFIFPLGMLWCFKSCLIYSRHSVNMCWMGAIWERSLGYHSQSSNDRGPELYILTVWSKK